MTHGSIHWSELISGDVEGSKKFFAEVCGWTIEAMPMPMGEYNVCKQGDTPVAGIMGVDQIENPSHDIAPHWMTYIAVDDVDASVDQIKSSGGDVINGPFDVPGVGRIAIVMDPGKAVCGIMTPASG